MNVQSVTYIKMLLIKSYTQRQLCARRDAKIHNAKRTRMIFPPLFLPLLYDTRAAAHKVHFIMNLLISDYRINSATKFLRNLFHYIVTREGIFFKLITSIKESFKYGTDIELYY